MKNKHYIIMATVLIFIGAMLSSECGQIATVIAQDQVTIPREQTYIFPWWTYGSGLNPILPNSFARSAGGNGIVYEPLALVFDWLHPMPVLAKEWYWVDDHTFEVKIHPEAHFRKGSPVTAEDVVFSLRIMTNESFGHAHPPWLKSIEAVDEHTVRITTTEDALPRLPLVRSLLGNPIFPKYRWSKLIEEYGVAGILDYKNLDVDEIDASGPYTLMSVAEDRIIYKRVENYWGHAIGRYFTPEYVMMIVTESNEVNFRMWQAGEIDASTSMPPTGMWEFAKARGLPWGVYDLDAEGVRGDLYKTGSAWPIIPNYEKLPIVLENEWLRHALAYAIDIDRIIEASMSGAAVPQNPSFIITAEEMKSYIDVDLIRETYETKDFNGIPYIKYDPEKAIEILKEHCEGSVEEGWTYNGEKIGPWTIIVVAAWPTCVTEIEMVAKYWSDIGIPTTVKTVDYAAWDSLVRARNFEWYRCDYCAMNYPAPAVDWAYQFLGKAQYPWDPNSPIWYEEYFPEDAEKIRDLLNKMLATPVGSKEYIKYAKEIQKIIVPQLPMIPVFHRVWTPGWYIRYWSNWPWKDDHPYYDKIACVDCGWEVLYPLQPSCVETLNFDLSPAVVEAGEPLKALVTLRNNGDYEHMYRVEISNGPAKPGPGPEIIASKGVVIPAGQTVTVEIDLVFEEPGSYTLTVDDWRIGKYDPGEPIEKTLVVLPKGAEEEYTVKDAIDAANAAKAAAEDAKAAAMDAAEAAKAAAEAVAKVAESATPAWMIWASMAITIIVVLVGVYVITKSAK